MPKESTQNVTWKEVSMFAAFGTILAGIVFSYAINTQKLDTISSRQDKQAQKISDLAKSNQDLAIAYTKLETIITTNQREGKLSALNKSIYAMAFPTPIPTLAFAPVLNITNQPANSSAQPVFYPTITPEPTIMPTPKPTPTPIAQLIKELLSPIPELIR